MRSLFLLLFARPSLFATTFCRVAHRRSTDALERAARARARRRACSRPQAATGALARAAARWHLIQRVRARSRALARSPLRALARARALARSRALTLASSPSRHTPRQSLRGKQPARNNLPHTSNAPLPPPPPPPPPVTRSGTRAHTRSETVVDHNWRRCSNKY